jgi:hypothetical protein
VRVRQQPGRQPAQVPLPAHLRSDPQNDEQSLLARLAHELGHICFTTELELSGPWFVQV